MLMDLGLGPIIGATVAAAMYKLLKMLEYETANPDEEAERGRDGSVFDMIPLRD
jgi:hypothetical protein